jgi:hypothetical protein
MKRPDVKTPGRGDGAGVGETSVEREFDDRKHATLGGLRRYEAEKRKIVSLGLPALEYQNRCRTIADLVWV